MIPVQSRRSQSERMLVVQHHVKGETRSGTRRSMGRSSATLRVDLSPPHPARMSVAATGRRQGLTSDA